MPKFNEQTLVEDYFIKELVKKGWKYVPANELDRDSYDEPLLINNLIRQIRKINNVELSEEDIKNVLNELKLQPTTQEGHKKTLQYLKEGITIKNTTQNKTHKPRTTRKKRIHNNPTSKLHERGQKNTNRHHIIRKRNTPSRY